jgi:predicted PhzF superfamily epimerase YddE/YHI9
MVELGDAEAVRSVEPEMALLRQVDARGLIVTAKSDDARFDFVCRFFGPAVGIDEDPVTGSAHCTLAPMWSRRLGRSRLVSFQASSRGGVVTMDVRGDRIDLGGRARTVLVGQWQV